MACDPHIDQVHCASSETMIMLLITIEVFRVVTPCRLVNTDVSKDLSAFSL